MTLLSAWPAVSNDTGNKTSGTIWNELFNDAQREAVEGLIHSTNNPDESPADIIDEVVDARGNLVDLDTRISAVVDADGTPVANVPEASETVAGIVSIGTQDFGGQKRFAAGPPLFRPGGSASYDGLCIGKLATDFNAVGNVGAGEDNLMLYPLPANVLNTSSRGLKVTAGGQLANNGNAVTLKFYFGATAFTFFSAITTNKVPWWVEIFIGRLTATTQVMMSFFDRNGVQHLVQIASPAETLSGAVTMRFTGEGVANNDIVQNMMLIEVV